MDDQRERLKRLILDAEALMEKAKSESSEIVANANAQARELVDAARRLHAAAESESTKLASEAELLRARAEADAQALANDAREKHRLALEEAKRVVSDSRSGNPPRVDQDPTDSPRSSTSDDQSPEVTPDDILNDASRRADQMLRVARSEAKARSSELLEDARRRAAQIDEDARRREDVAAKQHRQLQKELRDDELSLRSHIAELRADLRTLEAEVAATAAPGTTPSEREITIDVEPLDPEVSQPSNTTDTRRSREDGPTTAASPNPAERTPVTDRHDRDARDPEATEPADEAYAQAIRRFRRRA